MIRKIAIKIQPWENGVYLAGPFKATIIKENLFTVIEFKGEYFQSFTGESIIQAQNEAERIIYAEMETWAQ